MTRADAMASASVPRWKRMQTDETRMVERALRDAGFNGADAYRYNSASIRVRVIDERFEGLKPEKRDELVEPILDKLPEQTQADIITLLTFAPSELQPKPTFSREYLMNLEFDDPSPSTL
jgi:hypothetical protein